MNGSGKPIYYRRKFSTPTKTPARLERIEESFDESLLEPFSPIMDEESVERIAKAITDSSEGNAQTMDNLCQRLDKLMSIPNNYLKY